MTDKKHTNYQAPKPANNPKQKNLTNQNVSRNVSRDIFNLYNSHVLRGLQIKVRVSLGHHLAVSASLLQDSQHRKTGPRAGFFVPDDLPLPALCVVSLYPHLYPEKNNELWDTRIKLPPGENRLIKLK